MTALVAITHTSSPWFTPSRALPPGWRHASRRLVGLGAKARGKAQESSPGHSEGASPSPRKPSLFAPYVPTGRTL